MFFSLYIFVLSTYSVRKFIFNVNVLKGFFKKFDNEQVQNLNFMLQPKLR